MARVARCGCDAGVDPGGLEPHGRVLRIAVGVQRVVSGARMTRISGENRGRDRARLKGYLRIRLARSDRREQRERIKRSRLVVFGVGARELADAVWIRAVPR